MSFVAALETAGYLPLRDHNPKTATAEGLSIRNVRYAGAIAERDDLNRWLFEEDSVGDVNCATLLAVDPAKRSIPGWAYAWPMVTSPDDSPAAVTTPGSQFTIGVLGGTQSAIALSASLVKPGIVIGGSLGATPLDPQAARVKKRFITVGAPGGGGGNGGVGTDFSTAKGWTNLGFPPFGNGSWTWHLFGSTAAPFGFGTDSWSLHIFSQYQGLYSNADPNGKGANRPFPGFGAKGPSGDAGSVGGAGSVFERPDVHVPLRPIFDDQNVDARFQKKTIDMDGSFPDFHKGALGITISGVKEKEQFPLYFPTDPRLIAVEYGSKPSAASLVCDLNGDAMVDPFRTARLHSLVRVIKGPGGGVIGFGDNVLALNYGVSQQGKGIPGYGAIIDQGEGEGAPRVVTITSIGSGTTENTRSSTTLHIDRPMKPVFGDQVVGLMSFPQASGPVTPGASKGDKHQFGVDADGHPIQSAHLACDAYWKAADDTEFDAPLDFSSYEYPKVHTPSYLTSVTLAYDGSKQHPFRGGPKQGMWRWYGRCVIGDGGGTTPTPTPRTPNDPPPPTTPGIPVPPAKPPPPVTPPIGPPTNNGVPTGFAGAQFRTGIGSREDATWYGGRRLPMPPPATDIPSFPAPSSTVARPWEREDKADHEARTHRPLALPSILARALSLNRAHGSVRGAASWTPEQAQAWHGTSPTVGRIDAFGGQRSGGDFLYTQKPGQGRYDGGTGNGGWLLMPPEFSLEDYATSFARASRTSSTTYFAAAPGVWFGAGYPIPTTGGLKSGVRWGLSSGFLNFDALDSAGAAVTAMRLSVSGQTIGIRESGGQMLDVGAIPDGQVLIRSANGIVGSPRILTSLEPAASQRTFCSDLGDSTAFALVATTAYFVYLGKTVAAITPQFVEFLVTSGGVGAQTAEVGFFSTPAAPSKTAQILTKLVATATVDSLTSTGVKRNTSAFATSIPAGTHLWAGIRTNMAVGQPTLLGIANDLNQGRILDVSAAAALTGTTFSGAIIVAGLGLGASCPYLTGTLD